jgi:small subunit ribosomal protein S1
MSSYKALDLKALRKQTSVPEDFAVENNPQRAEFEALLKEKENKQFKTNSVVSGKVVAINNEYVVVDVGSKSEGQIPTAEFRNVEGVIDVKIGDVVDVYADYNAEEDSFTLSKDRADKLRIWDKISQACEMDELVRGRVTARVKGGLSVNIEGVKAFLPGSQVDIRPIRNLEKFLNEDHDFKVIKFNKRRGNIVLSRRVLLETERATQKKATLAKLIEGEEMEGTVKNITDYGAFIDLGGIDGLLHITDMSWGRITKPEEIAQFVKENETIRVKVLKFSPETERVSLGLKQLTADPWTIVVDTYKVGDTVSGKVVSLTEYGAFVELQQGIEGLIHISEMSWTKRIKHPSQMVAIGQEVESVVLDIDTENKRISLGMKQTSPNPWTMLHQKYPVGTHLEGKIRNITEFGIFIGITDGIDGLVHISDLSWTQKIKHPSELYEKGQTVEAVVLNIDVENERFSLGIKQLTQDVWAYDVPKKYNVGKLYKAAVLSSTVVELEKDIRAELDAKADAKEGDEIVVEITRVDKDAKAIYATVKTADASAEVSSYLPSAGNDSSEN